MARGNLDAKVIAWHKIWNGKVGNKRYEQSLATKLVEA